MKQTALYLVEMRSFPVQLGELVFYAGSWKLTGVRQYAEQGGVLGTGYVTNSSARARRLVLDGWIRFTENPGDVILQLDSAIAANRRFVFDLRGVRFVAVNLVEYAVQEAAKDGLLHCTLTLITPNTLTAPPEETEGSL